MPRFASGSFVRVLLCLLWGSGVLFGLYKAALYSATSGDSGYQPLEWPVTSSVAPAHDRPTLLITLHPRCVCSYATLEELTRLLAQIDTPIHVEILVYEPANASGWSSTALIAKARAIPGVAMRIDSAGTEAARFGMSISGHVALYAVNRQLLFSGGITPSRGHEGDNAGRSSIVSLLAGIRTETIRSYVFGCSIKH